MQLLLVQFHSTFADSSFTIPAFPRHKGRQSWQRLLRRNPRRRRPRPRNPPRKRNSLPGSTAGLPTEAAAAAHAPRLRLVGWRLARREFQFDPAVALERVGRVAGFDRLESPKPAAARRLGEIPCAIRNFTTDTARAVDSSQFEGNWGVLIVACRYGPRPARPNRGRAAFWRRFP